MQGGNKKMNYFEYFAVGFVLSINPKLIWSKKERRQRKYILKEIKQGRGIL